MDSVLREEQVLRRDGGIQGGDGSHPKLSRSPSPHRARRKFVLEDVEARRALALKQRQVRTGGGEKRLYLGRTAHLPTRQALLSHLRPPAWQACALRTVLY